jgi:hypothetical protein
MNKRIVETYEEGLDKLSQDIEVMPY